MARCTMTPACGLGTLSEGALGMVCQPGVLPKGPSLAIQTGILPAFLQVLTIVFVCGCMSSFLRIVLHSSLATATVQCMTLLEHLFLKQTLLSMREHIKSFHTWAVPGAAAVGAVASIPKGWLALEALQGVEMVRADEGAGGGRGASAARALAGVEEDRVATIPGGKMRCAQTECAQ
eukprot:scaffold94566_cov27-Tisochrysis_lutea.AAC.1